MGIYILIVVWSIGSPGEDMYRYQAFNTSTAYSSTEFGDATACNAAIAELKGLPGLRAGCVPKFTVPDPAQQLRNGIKGAKK